MRTHILTPLLVAGAFVVVGLAQEPPPPPPAPAPGGPPPDAPPGPHGFWREHLRGRAMEKLSPEERKRVEQARKKALEDPKIAELRRKAEAANREFVDALQKKMLEADPALAGILPKMRPGHREGPGGKGRGPGGGWAALEEGERQRLVAAREIARQAPQVQIAEQKRQAAQTREERKQATKEYREALRAAMLAADPSLAPLLEKISPKGVEDKR